MEKIVIIGYGGHAKSVADSIRFLGIYEIAGYTDVEDRQADLPYLGTDDALRQIYASGVTNAAFGVGYMGTADVRDRLYETAKNIGFSMPPILDPTAILAADAAVGEGTYVGKRAVVNAGSRVGKMCIINTGAIAEHECVIGDFTHLAVGATLCGQVRVGTHCLIGASSTVLQCLSIGDHVTVGAGAVVTKDTEKDRTVAGVPARLMRMV